ncbi:MAG: aldo/keto reductase [Bacillota bacterium]|nr:aldo/keto reductase [Bacillota bacterium]
MLTTNQLVLERVEEMKYRRLGRTGWRVSVIGMGGIPIQRVDRQEASEIIREALVHQINFFDSARGYTDSEEKFGRILSNENREKYIMATKCRGFSKEEMEKEINTSLQQLRVDQIDLYQLHNVRDMQLLKYIMSDDGAIVALKEAKQAGKIKEFGITGHIIPVLLEAIQTGEFATVQFPFNAIETSAAESLMKLATDLDVGMICMKPLAGGALANGELALKFILDYPVSTVIPGMDKKEQVQANAQVGNSLSQLTESEMNILQNEINSIGNIFCRRCDYCRPCPQGIDISGTFTLDSYWTRYGLKEWAVNRYRKLEINAGACIRCGKCQTKCPYDLPIIDMLARCHENMN